MGNPKQERDHTLKNIVILSVGFLLLMAAWLTTAAISQTVLQSVKVDDPSFTGDGYISLAIVNGAFAISNFLAPTIVNFAGVRTTLVFGPALYASFIASFIYPNEWLLYGTSALLGFAAANVWLACGCYFALSCSKENIGKYLGIYWTIMSVGQLLGSAFVFWRFQGRNHIDSDTRLLVMSVLTTICISCCVTMSFLGHPGGAEKAQEMRSLNFCASITEPFRILGNKHMLLLIPPSMLAGLEIAYFGSLFPTTVGFTEAFGDDSRKLVGVAGILIGAGTLIGGLVFGIFGDKIFKKNSRSLIVLVACIAFTSASFLMYLNHPNAAPLGPTKDTSWINPPSVPISLLIAFLLGLGDGCLTPQMTAAIGVIWPESASAPLAISRFFQAATCALGFFIGTLTGLYNQILIFVAISLLGTLTYFLNEIQITKRFNAVTGSMTQIVVVLPEKSSSGSSLQYCPKDKLELEFPQK